MYFSVSVASCVSVFTHFNKNLRSIASIPVSDPGIVFLHAETVRVSDPRLHQALHRPELAAQTRQDPLGQRAAGASKGKPADPKAPWEESGNVFYFHCVFGKLQSTVSIKYMCCLADSQKEPELMPTNQGHSSTDT